MKRILLSVPHMGGTEQPYVREAFDTNWLSTVGPNIRALEAEFEQRIGLPAVALSSGTAAIHLGLRLLGVGPGDEVFCSTLTFVAGCNPIRYLGAEPVFLDSDYATWNLDPNVLEDALRHRAQKNKLPRALMVVDLYGSCADMDPIRSLCNAYGVPVLEDAAEALGARYKGAPAGSLGDIGVISLNGNKIITATGGGMLFSQNAAWIEKARFWSQQARDVSLGYEHSEIGYNYAMSNVLAGIGRGQLQVLDLRVDQRRAIAHRYRDAFADLDGITLMPQPAYGLHTNWLSCFLIDESKFGVSRDEAIRALDEADIESRPVWKPMHLQPLYAGCARFGGDVAEDLSKRGICLPSSSSLTEEDQFRVIDCIRKLAGAKAAHRAPKPNAGLISTSDGGESAAHEPDVEELLGRTSVQLDESRIRESLRGRMVLVTGAAGSIGAELCRQIARFEPAGLVGFDIAESPLFEIDREMGEAYKGIPFRAEIGNIQSRARIDEVLRRHRPTVIYHAAAYKHVPLMEAHLFEAIENNVLGTWNVVAAAQEHGVEDFVFISSDKAVRPTSIMGATKRISEIMLAAIHNGSMKFVSVRFGNVLDSQGSVIPIFRKQIAAGGPVTVTHPEMRRFFMTIPEACQLVLEASVIGKDGQICILDMGQPVKILDLARTMIRRSGLRPDEDIKIEFTGIRPGEKLYEELSALLEDTVPTEHEKIRIFAGVTMPDMDLQIWLKSLSEACAARDSNRLIAAIRQMVSDYNPGGMQESAGSETPSALADPSTVVV